MLSDARSKNKRGYANVSTDVADMFNLIRSGVHQYMPFNEFQCSFLEEKIDEIIRMGESGLFKDLTIDRAPLRNKYFFGERYSYGSQMNSRGLGNEKLFHNNAVDPIPDWVSKFVIRPLELNGVIKPNFVNSVVIVVYQPGGCIAPHIDPPQLFDRPVISVSLLCTSSLSFGSKFLYKPLRATEPFLSLNLPRGVVTLLSGFAADGITHSIRPQDTTERRAVILLRRVLEEAPRMLPPLRTNINDMYCTNIDKPVNDLAKKLDYEKYSFLKIISSLCNQNSSILDFADNYSSMENFLVGNAKVQRLTSQADLMNNIATSDKGKESFSNNTNFSFLNYFAKN